MMVILEQIYRLYILKTSQINLAIFIAILLGIGNLFYPNNTALGYIAFAFSASLLAIIGNYNDVLKRSYMIVFVSILLMLSLAFVFIGYKIIIG